MTGLKGGRMVQTDTICVFGVVPHCGDWGLSRLGVTLLSLQMVLPRGR